MKQNRIKGWMFVAVQFTFSPIVVVLAYLEHNSGAHSSSDLNLIISLILFALSLIIGLSAVVNFKQWVTPVPVPRLNSKFVKRGIYSVIRHPMYLSVILFVFSCLIYFQAVCTLIPFLLLIYFFTRKIVFEEKLLVEKFPGYKSYQSETKKLLPYVY